MSADRHTRQKGGEGHGRIPELEKKGKPRWSNQVSHLAPVPRILSPWAWSAGEWACLHSDRNFHPLWEYLRAWTPCSVSKIRSLEECATSFLDRPCRRFHFPGCWRLYCAGLCFGNINLPSYLDPLGKPRHHNVTATY